MIFRILIALMIVFLGWLLWLHSDGSGGVIGNLRQQPIPIHAASVHGAPLRAISEQLLSPLDIPVADQTDDLERIVARAEADLASRRMDRDEVQSVQRLQRMILRLQAERDQYLEGLAHIRTRPIETLQRPANPERTREFLVQEHMRSWETRAAMHRSHIHAELRALHTLAQ